MTWSRRKWWMMVMCGKLEWCAWRNVCRRARWWGLEGSMMKKRLPQGSMMRNAGFDRYAHHMLHHMMKLQERIRQALQLMDQEMMAIRNWRTELQGWFTTPSHIWHDAGAREPEERPRTGMVRNALKWCVWSKEQSGKILVNETHDSPTMMSMIRMARRPAWGRVI